MSETDDFKIGCLFVVVPISVVLLLLWWSAENESRTYNRLTGAHTTAWDALWVELRVQDSTKDESR